MRKTNSRRRLAFPLSFLTASFVALTAASLQPRELCAAMIVHTNDVAGEIEPCGCRSNPQGGMARKANLLKRLPDQSILQLDAGDLLFPTLEIPKLLEEQSLIQADYLLKSMAMNGQDAITPGEKDFAMGVAAFDKLRKKYKSIHFLAANLERRKGGAKAMESSVIFDRRDGDRVLKIAVLGLVGEKLPWPRELKTTSALAVAKREIPRLRKKADFVVVLSHLGLDDDKALAKAVPGIDMIFGAHTQAFLQTPLKVGNTFLYQSSIRNQYVGVLPLTRPLNNDAYQLVGLDAGYNSPEGQPGETDKLVKEFKEKVAEVNSKQENLLLSQAPADHGDLVGGAGASQKFQTFPHCAECHVKQFEFWRKTNHALALRPLIEKDQFKNRECLGCHTVGLGDPQGFISADRLGEFRHPAVTASPKPAAPSGGPGEDAVAEVDSSGEPSGAMQTEYLTGAELEGFLRKVHDAGSLDDKIKLPAAGPEEMPLRSALNRMTHSWTPVQCENCHGPAHDHPFGGTYSKKVETTTCLGCHTPDRAPEWYLQGGVPDLKKIEGKRAMVTCPAGAVVPNDGH